MYLDPNTEFDNEFILVQVSTHRVQYRDHQVRYSTAQYSYYSKIKKTVDGPSCLDTQGKI